MTFKHTALLLIDIQYDFLEGGALAVPDASSIFPAIENLRNQFPFLVATQDWHPPGHASFASTHPGKNPFETMLWKGQKETLWPDHCVQNSPGAALHQKVLNWKPDAIFQKGMDRETDSYSAFFDNHHLYETGLDSWLKRHEINNLFIAGLATDYCVKFSVLDALQLGYSVSVLVNGIRAVGAETGKKALEDMEKAGARLVI